MFQYIRGCLTFFFVYICVSDSYFFLSDLIVPQIVRQFIYFLNERPRHMPQIVRQFIYRCFKKIIHFQ
jgi:hypothetical protein